MSDLALMWFRRDLRLQDNPALFEASKSAQLIPFYIHSNEQGAWPLGAASRCYLHSSLLSLQNSLTKLKSGLIIRKGSYQQEIKKLATESGARSIYWNRVFDPSFIDLDQKLASELRALNLEVHIFDGSVLLPPETLKTQSQRPYQVFTPFWKNILSQSARIEEPADTPKKFGAFLKLSSLNVEELKFLPQIKWHKDFDLEQVGEEAVQKNWKKFLTKIHLYPKLRDFPAEEGTSRLSSALHFGEIGPKYLWHQAISKKGSEIFLKELVWREFAQYLLFHFPKTDLHPLKKEFEKFPWSKNSKFLRAWKNGETGYPIVDAGMRQLWQSGWMHNRVRMIVASFLVKNLLQPWQEGAKWFWETLLDADLGNNTLGWQWVAGCGADAAPYYRIFNPVLQGEKFDPKGIYVKKWIPELKDVEAKFIHQPWLANKATKYPNPIVDLKKSRDQALKAFKEI